MSQSQLSSFTLFPCLPPELRDLIWNHAIFRAGPRAHWFSIYHAKTDRRAVLDEPDATEMFKDLEFCPWPTPWPRSLHSYFDKFRLAAPNRPLSNDPPSWVDGNRSAYLIDRGLWWACRESRSIVRQWHDRGRPINLPKNIIRGQLQPLLICWDRDLIILQPWSFGYHGFVGSFNGKGVVETIDRWLGLTKKNLALEFSAQFENHPKYTRFFSTLSKFSRPVYAPRLWIIDYNLRRIPGVAIADLNTTERRAVFHANGCTFYEYTPNDSAREIFRDQGGNPGPAAYSEDARSAVEVFLLDMFKETWARASALRRNLMPRMKVGVLACEDMDAMSWNHHYGGLKRPRKPARTWWEEWCHLLQ